MQCSRSQDGLGCFRCLNSVTFAHVSSDTTVDIFVMTFSEWFYLPNPLIMLQPYLISNILGINQLKNPFYMNIIQVTIFTPHILFLKCVFLNSKYCSLIYFTGHNSLRIWSAYVTVVLLCVRQTQNCSPSPPGPVTNRVLKHNHREVRERTNLHQQLTKKCHSGLIFFVLSLYYTGQPIYLNNGKSFSVNLLVLYVAVAPCNTMWHYVI